MLKLSPSINASREQCDIINHACIEESCTEPESQQEPFGRDSLSPFSLRLAPLCTMLGGHTGDGGHHSLSSAYIPLFATDGHLQDMFVLATPIFLPLLLVLAVATPGTVEATAQARTRSAATCFAWTGLRCWSWSSASSAIWTWPQAPIAPYPL